MKICIFAKPPDSGDVKTRLALAPPEAARLARAFLDDTIESVRALPWAKGALATTAPFDCALPVLLQGEGDLGARIERVLRAALSGQWGSATGLPHHRPQSPCALAIGADAPALPARLLEAARDALDHADAVLGPAEDGGFYLLGLKRCPEGLLADLPWSAPDTCARTEARLRERGFRVELIAPWFDVDLPADLDRLRREIERGAIVAPRTAQVLRKLR